MHYVAPFIKFFSGVEWGVEAQGIHDRSVASKMSQEPDTLFFRITNVPHHHGVVGTIKIVMHWVA